MGDTSSLVEVHFLYPDKLDAKGQKVKGKTRTVTMAHVPRAGDMVTPGFTDEPKGTTHTVLTVLWFPTQTALAVTIILK